MARINLKIIHLCIFYDDNLKKEKKFYRYQLFFEILSVLCHMIIFIILAQKNGKLTSFSKANVIPFYIYCT